MSRVKENNEMLAELNEIPGIALRDEKISIPCIVGLLADISTSLAVIADSLHDTSGDEAKEDQGESEGGEF